MAEREAEDDSARLVQTCRSQPTHRGCAWARAAAVKPPEPRPGQMRLPVPGEETPHPARDLWSEVFAPWNLERAIRRVQRNGGALVWMGFPSPGCGRTGAASGPRPRPHWMRAPTGPHRSAGCRSQSPAAGAGPRSTTTSAGGGLVFPPRRHAEHLRRARRVAAAAGYGRPAGNSGSGSAPRCGCCDRWGSPRRRPLSGPTRGRVPGVSPAPPRSNERCLWPIGTPSASWDSPSPIVVSGSLCEPPDAGPHVRWCERGGVNPRP